MGNTTLTENRRRILQIYKILIGIFFVNTSQKITPSQSAGCYFLELPTNNLNPASRQSREKSSNPAVSFGLPFVWNDVFRKRNVMRTSCVMFASQVMCASRVSKEHITSLCTAGAIHHCALALHHCDEVATSLFTNAPKCDTI